MLQYHYLERPYKLVPLTAEEVPEPAYFDSSGKRLPDNAPSEKVYRTEYLVKLRKGIMYQEHPAFAKNSEGKPLYIGAPEKSFDDIREIKDFPETGTRELTSDDYIFQIKRLADPLVASPVYSILEKYILGFEEYGKALRAELEKVRSERRKLAGASYNQTLDEQESPIILDYNKYPLDGVARIDDHAYKIILKTKYPQFIYWLAMQFFSPMPGEAIDFYAQGALAKKNITIDRFPVGTGPYMIDTFNPNMEIILSKNRNYHVEAYPSQGEPEDSKTGLLKYAGEKLPFIDKVVFKLEKEAIPRWNKFLQGYYDSSGITSDSFDQAVTFSEAGRAELTPWMEEKGIRLLTSVRPSIYYLGFNMLDDVVGGYTPEKQKLRQAIAIAIDYEEYIGIFANGRGIPAMSPLPPGIFGHKEGRDGVNPYVYEWNDARNRAERKSIERARKLLAEAGFPGGRDKSGRPIVISFDNPWTGADTTPIINWYIRRLKLLGIQLENRTTDYNRFQDKMFSGNFQLFPWGWNADYPDPENFLFLLAGPNGKVKFQGENTSNYANPEFDRLFKIMEKMENSPERQKVIDEMLEILRKDSPLVFGYHPVAFGLYHKWVENIKPNPMANNSTKYIRVDAAARQALRDSWNRPNFKPIVIAAIIFILLSIPAALSIRRRRKGALGLKGME